MRNQELKTKKVKINKIESQYITKKQNISNYKTVEDIETGQLEVFETKIIKEEKDELDKNGWRRHDMKREYQILKQYTPNKRIDILEWIILRINKNNEVDCKIKDIVEDCGTTKKTVVSALNSLKELKYLKKVGQSKYVLNPFIISVYGNRKQNQKIIDKYEFEPFDDTNYNEEIKKAEKLEIAHSKINALEEEIKRLKKGKD